MLLTHPASLLRSVLLPAALVAATLAPLVSAPRLAHACLWDRDTLKEESLGQRDVVDVVSGRVLTHSRYFYEQKVVYTEPLVARDDAPAERFDDLAVAYFKLGRVDDALATLAAKEKRFPGQYTTAANRGSFLAAKGDLPGALAQLRAAVKINPDAHFGREKYQIQLLEFVVRVAKDGSLPERENFLSLPMDVDNYQFVLNAKKKIGPGKAGPELPADVKSGIVGMIRFGGGDASPHLWFGLGIVVAWQGDKHLAVRAFRRAELLGHPLAAAHAKILVRAVSDLNPRGKGDVDALWAKVAPELDAEWRKGEAWVARQQAAEDARLHKGKYKAVFGY